MDKRSGEGESWEALAHRAQFKPARLALICDVSLRTVQRHFSKQYGMKVGEWLRSVRLHNAYWRLRKGDSVKEIAIDLGYTQVSNFSRDFKRFHGFCPSLIRGHRLPLERPERTSTLAQV